jgi:hypothetical protein
MPPPRLAYFQLTPQTPVFPGFAASIAGPVDDRRRRMKMTPSDFSAAACARRAAGTDVARRTGRRPPAPARRALTAGIGVC